VRVWLGVLILVLASAIACSRRESPKQEGTEGRAIHVVRVYDAADRPVVSLDLENKLRAGDGRLIGNWDERGREIVVDGIHQTLDGVVAINGRQLELDLPIGRLKAELRADELWVDGRQFGRVEGVGTSREDMRRLSALIVAMPMLPTSVAPVDAGQADAVLLEPPLPPPPPRPN